MPGTTELDSSVEREEMADAIREMLAISEPSLKPKSIAFSPSPYASSHLLLDVAVSAGSSVTHFVLKDTGNVTNAAEASRPDLPGAGDREAYVYSTLLHAIDGPPRFYGALRRAGRHWLLLERVRGRELTKVGDRRIWRRAARWLGQLHGSDAGPYDGGISRGEAYFRKALRRALPAIESAAPDLRLNRVASAWDDVVGLLLANPVSLVHGDAFPGNVVLGAQDRVCFVDWELAGTGPRLLDLAALTSGSWTESERDAMVQAYSVGLRSSRRVALDGTTRHLLVCRVLVAVEMIGAMHDWEPPSHQYWDWPTELAGLATELRL